MRSPGWGRWPPTRIRNPIGVIRGAVELVQERAGASLGPDDREALDDVLGEVERLRRLTQDFLDLARDPPLTLATADLAALAAEAANGLGLAFPGVAVQLSVPTLVVEIDGERMRQLLSNLLVNAAQAGARNVQIAGGREGRSARLRIVDDGPGVTAELCERLFEPFATGRPEGTGLGLAIARRVAERHGGRLQLLATGGGGATFELRLPLAAEDVAPTSRSGG